MKESLKTAPGTARLGTRLDCYRSELKLESQYDNIWQLPEQGSGILIKATCNQCACKEQVTVTVWPLSYEPAVHAAKHL